MAPASFCCSKAKASNTSAVFIWISLRHRAENPSEASEAHYELRQCVRHQRDNELCRHPIFGSIKQFYSNKWEELWINRSGSCIRLTCLEASDAADILFWCVYLFMLISPADYPAEATPANMSAVEQKKLFLKRITVKSTNSGTGAAFLPKYLISLCRLTPHDCIWIFHVQVTKKSPLKAPKTTSILQTPPANKVCKSTQMLAFLFFCIKRNTTQRKCASLPTLP